MKENSTGIDQSLLINRCLYIERNTKYNPYGNRNPIQLHNPYVILTRYSQVDKHIQLGFPITNKPYYKTYKQIKPQQQCQATKTNKLHTNNMAIMK